jgi:hypothetical protein
MIHYLDINAKFLTDDGTLTKDIMPDLLHLNKKGYGIWAAAMEAKIAELMGESREKGNGDDETSCSPGDTTAIRGLGSWGRDWGHALPSAT